MKIREVIELADEMKPNAFSEKVKLGWLSALEGKIAASIFLLAPVEIESHFTYHHPEDMDTELVVKPPYDDIYELYLEAKIDEANGEYNKYQNTMQIYNEHYANFLRWFAGRYDPAQGYMSEEVRATDGAL